MTMFFFTGTRKPNFKNIKPIDYNEYWRERGAKINDTLKDREIIFKNWIKDGSGVLDIACGNSRLLLELKNKKACRVRGFDISSLIVDKQNEAGVRALAQDVNSDDFHLEDSYDYIILSEILEHLACPEKLISSIKNKAGHLLISIPNSAFYRYRLGLLLKGRFCTQWFYHPAEHLRYWSHIDMLDWLEAMGLEVVDCKSANGLTIGPVRFLDIWKNLFGHQIVYLCRVKQERGLHV